MINLKQILNETFELYRLEHLDNIIKTLRDNKIYLTPSTAPGMGYEDKLNQGKGFYLSMMRSKWGNYAKGGPYTKHDFKLNDSVIVHFDGQALEYNYKIVPVDYWQDGPTRSENEERLISDKQYIPNASRYIIDIFVFMNAEYPDNQEYYKTNYHEMDMLAKKRNINTYYYGKGEESAFKRQDKSKGHTSIDDVLEFPKAAQSKHWGLSQYNDSQFSFKYVAHWYFHHEEIAPRNANEKKHIDRWRKFVLYYENDFATQLANNIHNDREHKDWPEFQDLADMFRDAQKKGMKTTKDLWKHIYEVAHKYFDDMGKRGEGPLAPWDPEHPDKPKWYNK